MFWRVRNRRLGLYVFALATVLLSALMITRAWGADTEHFNRVAGWANILALIIGALGVGLALWRPLPRTARTPAQIADALTRQVLESEGLTLSEMLSNGQAPGRPARVYYEASGGMDRGDLATVAGFYQRATSGRMVVLGAPGAGKTVLLLTLICQLAEARRTLDDSARRDEPVPLRFDLAGWSTSLGIQDWLAKTIAQRFTNVTLAAYPRWSGRNGSCNRRGSPSLGTHQPIEPSPFRDDITTNRHSFPGGGLRAAWC